MCMGGVAAFARDRAVDVRHGVCVFHRAELGELMIDAVIRLLREDYRAFAQRQDIGIGGRGNCCRAALEGCRAESIMAGCALHASRIMYVLVGNSRNGIYCLACHWFACRYGKGLRCDSCARSLAESEDSDNLAVVISVVRAVAYPVAPLAHACLTAELKPACGIRTVFAVIAGPGRGNE